MRGVKILFMGLIFATGCVELYEFTIKNENPSLVIEGRISDMSYNEYMDLPAEGRYFSVRLSLSGDVVNERNKPVNDACVTLVDSNGSTWDYVASEANTGLYFLEDKDFKAVPRIAYKLMVLLPEGGSFESDWETIPEERPGTVGEIAFEEVIRQQYVYKNRERVLDNIHGVNFKVGLQPVTGENPIYYQWSFDATWIYRATLLSSSHPNYRCWISDPYYLSDYVMHRDNTGGYKHGLFFLAVDGNDRIFDRISFLVSQFAISEKYYNYWTEIQEQDQRKGLFDPPPYNLISNLHSDNPEQMVYGYFAVVGEQGKRWYFSRLDLENPVPNTWREFCASQLIIPPPKCANCLEYDGGNPTNEKPWWWEE
jgi:hypothetical protein